jgi:hypothetical protein
MAGVDTGTGGSVTGRVGLVGAKNYASVPSEVS